MAKSWSQRFDVEPMPTPRLRFRRMAKGVATYYPGEYSSYMEKLGEQYAGHSFGDLPLSVEVTFSLPRPKSHYGTGKNSDVLKDGSPGHPVKKADIDNYVKGTLDALKGKAWEDDRQVVELTARKVFGEPFIHIFIARYE